MSADPTAAAPPGRDLVFVSYSRDDAQWMQAFRVMLAPVLEIVGYRLWVDTDIRVGDEWSAQIEAAIARSEAALLLVSPRFLASDFIRRRELPALRTHGVRLAPILVGPSAYERVPPELAAVQWLHDPGRDGPLNLVDQVEERDRRIRQACEKLLGLLPERERALQRSDTSGPALASIALPADVSLLDEPGELSGVPLPPPGYVAREELAELIAAVTGVDTGAVGLHGQGGTGKSVLAAAVAREPEVRRRFPGGVFWVTVGETGDVLAAQLDLLGRLEPAASKPSTPAQAQRALAAALADRRVLLVVDDVWSDAVARTFRVTGPRARVVYTTRDERVLEAAGASPFRVEVLSRAVARALAVAVLATDDDLPTAADAAIEEVGRVALAVALLAAAVRGGRMWEQVAADLARAADVFGAHPYANAFKAMQIAVAALPDDLGAALLGLAVFPPDSRIPAAAIIRYWAHTRGVTATRAQADLLLLADANTLTLSGDAVEFHDLQHDYLLLHAEALPGLHGALLDAYRSQLSEPDGWWRLDPDEPYIWEHLIGHFRGAGARELAATVADPRFLIHPLAVGGVLRAERDLAEAAEPLPGNEVIGWWRAWLPRHTHVLALPAEITGTRERVRALAPTLQAWLTADRTRPEAADPESLGPLTPAPQLAVGFGLTVISPAQIRVLPGRGGDDPLEIALRDLEAKVTHAMTFRGARYLHVLVPCPLGWGSASRDTIKLARLARDTGLFPVFEAEFGEVVGVSRIRARRPVAEYLQPQKRFAHLFGDPGRPELVAGIQAIADRNVRRYGLLEES